MSVQTHSRFKILERPCANPGKCAVCGSSDRPVVDFGFDLDWYGTVYFCVKCLTEIASVVNMVPVEALHAYEGEFEQTLNKHLSDNNLMLVPRELFNNAVRSVAVLSDCAADSVRSIRVEDANGVHGENDATTGNSDAIAPDYSNGAEQTPKQSPSSAVRKGRNKLSADSVDGDLFSLGG